MSELPAANHMAREPGEQATVRVVVHPDGAHLVVRVIGEADLHTSATVRSALWDAVATATRPVIVDLSGLQFCDLSGLDVLRDVEADAAAAGRPVRFRGVSPLLSWLHGTFTTDDAAGAADWSDEDASASTTGAPDWIAAPGAVPHGPTRPWPTR